MLYLSNYVAYKKLVLVASKICHIIIFFKKFEKFIELPTSFSYLNQNFYNFSQTVTSSLIMCCTSLTFTSYSHRWRNELDSLAVIEFLNFIC